MNEWTIIIPVLGLQLAIITLMVHLVNQAKEYRKEAREESDKAARIFLDTSKTAADNGASMRSCEIRVLNAVERGLLQLEQVLEWWSKSNDKYMLIFPYLDISLVELRKSREDFEVVKAALDIKSGDRSRVEVALTYINDRATVDSSIYNICKLRSRDVSLPDELRKQLAEAGAAYSD